MLTRYGTMMSNSSLPGALPFADWVTFEKSVETANALAARKEDEHKADLGRLMATIEWTMNRESDAADVIQGLAFRIDGTSELGERAREHAAELKRLSMRLDVLVRKMGASSPAERASAKVAGNAIAKLDENAATIILVQYLIRHAQATSEVLEGVGSGLNAKAIQFLCRKVMREKQRIAAWIETHGHIAGHRRAALNSRI